MTFRLVDGKWDEEFTEALSDDTSELRIICPFIKVGALQRLLCPQLKLVQVITRFNLGDCADRVSDVAALRKLLEADARVRGVRNLHAKLYLFGKKRAIITSCNLTEAAFSRNHELGVVTSDVAIIEKCLEYFENLWCVARNDLVLDQVDAWDRTVTDYWLAGGRPHEKYGLDDFGVDTGITESPPVQAPIVVSTSSQAIVKFLGSKDDRSQLSELTIEEIKRAGCHWAVGYPTSRRPRSVQDDAIVFIGRLTRNPDDIRIFGRAIGMAYREDRDDATEADIIQRPWKERWPHYIRVHHAEFVDGSIGNGVSLNKLMDKLGTDSFATTKENKALGKGNTDPRSAFPRQPHVRLSAEGLLRLSEWLQDAFEVHGKVSQESLDKLDWPEAFTISSL
jgi:hypothetical protein